MWVSNLVIVIRLNKKYPSLYFRNTLRLETAYNTELQLSVFSDEIKTIVDLPPLRSILGVRK